MTDVRVIRSKRSLHVYRSTLRFNIGAVSDKGRNSAREES